MSFLLFISGFLFAILVIDIFKKILIIQSFMTAERQLLFISLSLLQYKSHIISLIEIAYDRAAEEDASLVEEKKKVIEKIQEKFLYFSNDWILTLKNNLPYKTDYSNWPEAIEYADKLFSKKR